MVADARLAPDVAVNAPQQLIDALADRYRIERELGQGGMATVYLAQDLRHERQVAVKVLRPDLAATLGSDRFLREIRIAAQLQHPHILPLLDSGDSAGFLYYVMPFVDGQSLRDRLDRVGELPVNEAVKLLCEIVDALALAHQRGVVHRDIKPDNIMLSGRHALVMDFGVAKAVSEATGRNQLTTAGVALGTPAYMAPEQAAGDPHLDQRVDIYAVGVMAYELLTGRTPFMGHTPQQMLAAHVTEAPEPVSRHRATIPAPLEQVVMRCLAKRPADRFQTAEELLGALEPLVGTSGGTTPTSTAPYTAATPAAAPWAAHPVRIGVLFVLVSVVVLGLVWFLTLKLGLPDWVPWIALVLLALGLPIMLITGITERKRVRAAASGRTTISGAVPLQHWFTWKRALLGGAAAFALLGIGTAVYTAMRVMGIGPVGTLVASGKLSARDPLIVADFVNHTPDSTLAGTLTEAFRIDLGQSPLVKMLSADQIHAALGRMNRPTDTPVDATVARELAQREGGKAVVVGDISPIGGGYLLSAKLISAGDGSELVALRETADAPSQLLPALDRLSKHMRERIGESLRSIRAGAPLEQVTTPSLEALRLYTEAERVFEGGDDSRSMDLLRQAVRVDSGFAMAWRKLAVLLNNNRQSPTEIIEASTKAYEHRDRLPEIERYQTVAWYHFAVDYDLDKTMGAERSIIELDPTNNIALHNLGVDYGVKRDWKDAEKQARLAIASLPALVSYQLLAIGQLGEGDSAGFQATLDTMAHKYAGSATMPLVRGSLEFVAGRYDTAATLLGRAAASSDPTLSNNANLSLAALRQTRGQLEAATQARRAIMDQSLRSGDRGLYLWTATQVARSLVLLRSDTAGAQQAIETALRTVPLDSVAPLNRPYLPLASTYAMLGNPDEAARLLAEYKSVTPAGIQRRDAWGVGEAAGLVALARRRPQEAIPALQTGYDQSGCNRCAFNLIGRAYEMENQPDSALAAYQRLVTDPTGLAGALSMPWTLAPSLKRLGELYEEKGDKAHALEYYGRFADLWKNADPELQPIVRDVKQRMAKLSGEPAT